MSLFTKAHQQLSEMQVAVNVLECCEARLQRHDKADVTCDWLLHVTRLSSVTSTTKPTSPRATAFDLCFIPIL